MTEITKLKRQLDIYNKGGRKCLYNTSINSKKSFTKYVEKFHPDKTNKEFINMCIERVTGFTVAEIVEIGGKLEC